MSKAISNNKYVSVFIPTYNGEKYLEECIQMLFRQELPNNYSLEVLITDSGSTDRTTKILEKYAIDVDVLKIPNSEFGHGKTRQAAAERAKGEFILFLSQDATPAHDRWLISLIEPFFLSKNVGCSFGAQVPRQSAPITIKREIENAFNSMGPRDSIILARPYSLVDTKPTNGLNSFFSDVNSAVRLSLLTGDVPFKDVPYAEDQLLAIDIQNAGFMKAYAPQAEVWHSNEYTVKEYFERKIDEYVGLQKSINLILPSSLFFLISSWIKPTLADIKYAFYTPSYTLKKKFFSLIEAPQYNLSNSIARYLAFTYSNDKSKLIKYSLEKNRTSNS